MYRGPVQTEARYRFVFELVVRTPLHIGAGKPEEGPTLFLRTAQGRPYIPGSSIKGMVRAGLSGEMGLHGGALLGEEDHGEPVKGGKLQFQDAVAVGEEALAFETHVALDEVTKTAKENLLFQIEYAPPGTRFEVVVGAPRLTQAEFEEFAGVLLEAQSRAASGEGPALAFASGQPRGWGAVAIEKVRAEVCDLREWLKAGAAGRPTYRPATMRQQPGRVRNGSGGPGSATVAIPVVVAFEGPVLVRRERKDTDGNRLLPVQDETGAIFLPGTSVRGALRAQAARIWRTILAQGGRKGSRPIPEHGAGVGDGGLHPFQRVFGAAGWRSPIQITDFRLVEGTGTPHKQMFVSIDRFTGGSSPERLFEVDETLYRPQFRGEIRIDVGRLAGCEWAIALGMFVLRDWMEGDIAIGSGAARGFGACTATATLPPGLGAVFVAGGQLDEYCELALQMLNWVESLKNVIAGEEAA